MSYDIALTGDRDPDAEDEIEQLYWGNYTSNIYPMWERAVGGSMRDLDGLLASEAEPILSKVIDRILMHREAYVALEPENKWGTVETFVPFLLEVRNACLTYPKALVRVYA